MYMLFIARSQSMGRRALILQIVGVYVPHSMHTLPISAHTNWFQIIWRRHQETFTYRKHYKPCSSEPTEHPKHAHRREQRPGRLAEQTASQTQLQTARTPTRHHERGQSHLSRAVCASRDEHAGLLTHQGQNFLHLFTSTKKTEETFLQPNAGPDCDDVSSDSESEDEDVFDTGSTARSVNNTEHSDPNSYSWLVLKLASLRLVQQRLNDFIAVSCWFVCVLMISGNTIAGRRLGALWATSGESADTQLAEAPDAMAKNA